MVSWNGVQVNDSRLRVIKDIPRPRNWTKVCNFLIVAGHFRRFVKWFKYGLDISRASRADIIKEKIHMNRGGKCRLSGAEARNRGATSIGIPRL